MQRVGILLVRAPADRGFGDFEHFGGDRSLGRLVIGARRNLRPPQNRQSQAAAIGLDQQHALALALPGKGRRVALGAPHRPQQHVERLGGDRTVRVDIVAGRDARALDRIAANEMGQIDDPAAAG